ncbi:hypothetical protein COO60DRAFT_1528059 [Scenedesmus sp. NREL 46B-D3]|nr:hypothetical protein COO60DRAFT_1528059 [Scenedesmus sp. NREL 46B-D3]
MAAARFLAAATLVLLACTALASDRTINTLDTSCKDMFKLTMTDHYAGDDCGDMITEAMSTVPTSASDCPNGVYADAGSEVQECMAKNQNSTDAWVAFIKRCEVLNVNERAGAGEAEAAADAKPSCFPRFNSLSAFTSYLEGQGGQSAAAATSTAGSVTAAQGAVLLAAAAAALLL